MIRLLYLSVSLLLLSCATDRAIHLYEGPQLAEQQLAGLIIPLEIDLLSVDGEPVATPFFVGEQVHYRLKAGQHDLIVRYKNLFESDGSSHEIITSPAKLFHIDMMKNQSYRIKHSIPQDLTTAKMAIKDFQPWIESSTPPHHIQSKAVPSTFKTSSLFGVLKSNNDLTAGTSAASSTQARDNMQPPLEQLKHWWQKASLQDQQSFDVWRNSLEQIDN